MTALKYILTVLFFLQGLHSSSQQQGPSMADTTISIFWNPNLKVRFQILDPEEMDIRKKNSVITLYVMESGVQHTLYRDSIFANIPELKIKDINGDGIKDLLVLNTTNGPQNKNYHLYIVNQKAGRFIRVKSFERIYNPFLDTAKCLIIGFESYEKELRVNRFFVDKQGNLGEVGWKQ